MFSDDATCSAGASATGVSSGVFSNRGSGVNESCVGGASGGLSAFFLNKLEIFSKKPSFFGPGAGALAGGCAGVCSDAGVLFGSTGGIFVPFSTSHLNIR
jgi:hypothetical protein